MARSTNVLGTIQKRTTEEFSFSVDFAAWLATGDTISTHSIAVMHGTTDYASTMVESSSDDDNSIVTAKIQAGTAGNQYHISVTANTANGDVWVAIIYLIVS